MAKKKEQPIESNNPYDAELEQHVDEMLAPEAVPAAPPKKKITITHHAEEATAEPEPEEATVEDGAAPTLDAEVSEELPVETVPIETPSAEAASAPLVPDAPVPKEPFKILVFHDEAEPVAPVAPEPTEEPPVEETPEEAAPLVVPDLPVEVTDEADEVEPKEPAEPETEPAPVETIASKMAEQELEEPFDDDKIEALVNDIAAKESDELLAAEDNRDLTAKPAKKQKSGGGLGTFFSGWRHNFFARWITILFFLAVIGSAIGVPTSRYYLLNKAGVKSSASLVVTDRSTQQPLKNATVKIGDKTAQTDEKGTVHLQNLRLGPTLLTIEKRAFAPVTQSITIGWGSNPLPSYDLAPTGTQYMLTITDYVSGKPVAAAATSEYADANADSKGIAKLTMDDIASKGKVDVTVTADGYRTEHVTISAGSKQQIEVKMVVSRKHAYISNRSGKYDVYATDIDGQNEKVLLAGTGSETSNMVLAPSSGNLIAVVSTRDNAKDKDGNLLSTLNILDLDSDKVVKVSQSAQIQLVGWSKNRLAYIQVASGADDKNADRQRLMSYNYDNRDNKQITSANTFNNVMAIGDKLYYAPNGGNSDPNGNFTRIGFDGNGKQPILVAESWNAFRTDYDHIVISVPGSWYEHTIGSITAKKLDSQPANTATRGYIDSPDGKNSMWVSTKNNKGTLNSYDVAAKKDTVVTTKDGLKYPISWLDNQTVVYRVDTDDETADYAISLQGGDVHKIHDVTATGSKDDWYYY